MTPNFEDIEKKRPEPLRTNVEVLEDTADPAFQDTWIHVGNSGLAIQRLKRPDGREEWNMDYTPEGATDPSPENRIKYATIFGHALRKFLEWLNGPEAKELSLAKPGIIKGMTNRVMMEYRQNLLGNAIRVTEADKENDQYWYELDINALAKDAQNMARLDALSRRAETQHYIMNE